MSIKKNNKNVISTWIYLDNKESEQKFSQTHLLSSSKEHQDIYWRCVYVFFKIAIYTMGNDYEYILFTNFDGENLIVDDIDILKELRELNVNIINREFSYKLPKGYYGAWGNQLYEFDILDEFVKHYESSKLLMLDSDCMILKDISEIFEKLDNQKALTFRGEYKNYPKDEKIDGITENEMLLLANNLLDDKNKLSNFQYICGEFFAATSDFIKLINDEFPSVYKKMVNIYNENQDSSAIKFNEEAHFLSFFYHKHKIEVGTADKYIKRLWSDDAYYKIKREDINLPIWHCITQKDRYSEILKKLNKLLNMNSSDLIFELSTIIFPSDFSYKLKTRNFNFRDICKFIGKKIIIFLKH